jgi:hypothetical protein
MPHAKARTTAARRSFPPPPSRGAPLPPRAPDSAPIAIRRVRDSPAGAVRVVDAFFGYVGPLPPGALVEQIEANGLRLVQRGAIVGLVSDDGLLIPRGEDEDGPDRTGPLPVAHIDGGVLYRDHTSYGQIAMRARLHIAIFEDAFAAWREGES